MFRLYFDQNLVRLGLALFTLWATAVLPLHAFQSPARPRLEDFDHRLVRGVDEAVSRSQAAAGEDLRRKIPGVRIYFDPVTGAAIVQSPPDRFLSDQEAKIPGSMSLRMAEDPNAAAKAFLAAHTELFGHGLEVLDGAKTIRDDVSRSGLRTAVFQQHFQGIAVFEGLITAHTTSKGSLVNVFSHASRVSSANRPQPALGSTPCQMQGISANSALARALDALQSVPPDLGAITILSNPDAEDLEQHQKLAAPGANGPCGLSLVWLPMDSQTLTLCWEVILTSRERGEMFRVLIDAISGEVMLRRCLTEYLSNATYRVYNGESPSPFSPGSSTPSSFQPEVVPRSLVVTNAFDTNASPAGWIADGDNETRGNNVDAHLDRDGDDLPDLPRPQGSPFRVFDYSLNLSQSPTNYGDAAVTQLFFLCNWYHDRLYELGFTETAGNFQQDNFGRGGQGNDAVQADAQDGGGIDNANFSTPPDGSPGRMQMYLFDGANPNRDGDLDAEIVFHEHTHGVSGRLVGGGVGISALQSGGMGEGWSDFYSLCLLSTPTNDISGNYHVGAYAIYQLAGFTRNYYFGIRRYPYSTDLAKSPLTFKDIDPSQASSHSGIPRNPIMGNAASEIHNQGEVWCAALWDARALLVGRLGFSAGNQLMLQLVTDGMKLSPANPNFIQGRDAILQADMVDNNGANQHDLWRGFAKRGLGLSASSPASSTTSGVHESFDTPHDLQIAPAVGFQSVGPVGGPFSPDTLILSLTNRGETNLQWSVSNTSAWLNVSVAAGSLDIGQSTNITADINPSAASLPIGLYCASLVFSNELTGIAQTRDFSLQVGQPDYFTELFSASDNDLAFSSLTFSPNGGGNFYSSCREDITGFYVDPGGGNVISLGDDSYLPVTLPGTNTVGLYGERTNVFFVGSNGYITFGDGDANQVESITNHFSRRRVSALFHDLDPSAQGTVSWKQLPDRVAITFQNVPQYSSTSPNDFQMELFYDGTIRLTYLELNCLNNLAGLSAGHGVPFGFTATEFSSNDVCAVVPPSIISQPVDQTAKLGASRSFAVLASGSQILSYRWQKDGVPLDDDGRIVGTTNAVLRIMNLGTNDAGTFSVIVSNFAGEALSSDAILTVSLLDHFAWAHIPAIQFVNVPFELSLRAETADNTFLSNYSGTVSLQGQVDLGTTTNTALLSPAPSFTNNGSFTLGYSFIPNTALTVTHFRHYFGAKVSIWTEAGTLLASRSVAGAPETWNETALSSPIQLQAGVKYRIGVHAAGNVFWRNDLPGTFPDGTIEQSFECGGDAFPTTQDSSHWWLVDFRYVVFRKQVLPGSPASADLSQGVWEGALTIHAAATNAAILADDGLGSSGISERLNIQPFPVLSARAGSNMLFLSWPAGAAGLRLESSTNLVPPLWSSYPQSPATNGDTNVLSIDVTDPRRFFRLHYSP